MSLILRRIFKATFLHQRWLTQTRTLKQEKKLLESMEICTGLQKKELKAFMEGNCDPYHMKMIKRGSGTKENPTLVPSAFHARIVGCICSGNRFVNYMWLEKDCPKRCECGHWFKLKKVEAFS